MFEVESVETDPRFPSGPWLGFWTNDPTLPGRHFMDVILTFQNGKISGAGSDRIGKFTFRGTYDVESGKAHWVKRYLGKHSVSYSGYNEGKGIWGVWEVRTRSLVVRGGFHIWPKATGIGLGEELVEEADAPVELEMVPSRS